MLIALVVLACACTAYQAERAAALVTAPEEFPAEAEGPAAPEVCESLELPGLDLLLVEMRDDSFDLAVAAARVREAEAVAQSAWASRWPALSLFWQSNRSNALVAGFPQPQVFGPGTGEVQEQHRGSAITQWELDLWGRVAAREEAAQQTAVAARAERRGMWVSLTAELADTLTTRGAEEQRLRLLEEQWKTSDRFLSLTRLRFAQGLAPAVDILRQRQQLESLLAEQALARARRETSDARLDALLGDSRPLVRPEAPAELPDPPPLPDPGVPAVVLARRPDVAAAWASLAAADANTAAAMADRLPAITLGANLFNVASGVPSVFQDLLWSVTGDAALTAFDAGRLAAEADAAQSRAERALYEYAQRVVESVSEVRSALSENRAQDVRVTSIARQLTDARRALDLERELYSAGQRDYLSVLTALERLQSLQQEQITAGEAQIAARVQLCRSLGLPLGESPPELR